MTETKRCEFCEKDISITNWSKHIKTNVHLRSSTYNIQYCLICNKNVPKSTWDNHLRTSLHIDNTNLFKNKIRNNKKSIKLKGKRKRNFEETLRQTIIL